MFTFVRNALNGRRKPASTNKLAKEQAKQDFLAKLNEANSPEETDRLLIELSQAKPFLISSALPKGVSKEKSSKNPKQRTANKLFEYDSPETSIAPRPLPYRTARVTLVSDSDSDSDSELEMETGVGSGFNSGSNTDALISTVMDSGNSNDNEHQQSLNNQWGSISGVAISPPSTHPEGTNPSSGFNESTGIIDKLLLDATARLQAASYSQGSASKDEIEPSVTREASVSFEDSDRDEIIDLTLSTSELTPSADNSYEDSSELSNECCCDSAESKYGNYYEGGYEPKDKHRNESEYSNNQHILNGIFDPIMELWRAQDARLENTDVMSVPQESKESISDSDKSVSESSFESEPAHKSAWSTSEFDSALQALSNPVEAGGYSESASESESESESGSESESESELDRGSDSFSESESESESESAEDLSNSDVEVYHLTIDSGMSSDSTSESESESESGSDSDSGLDADSASSSASDSDSDSDSDGSPDYVLRCDEIERSIKTILEELKKSSPANYASFHQLTEPGKNPSGYHALRLDSADKCMRSVPAKHNHEEPHKADAHTRSTPTVSMMKDALFQKLANEGRNKSTHLNSFTHRHN